MSFCGDVEPSIVVALLLRFDWVVPAVQVALFVAAAEWVRFAILLTVAALTALPTVPLHKS